VGAVALAVAFVGVAWWLDAHPPSVDLDMRLEAAAMLPPAAAAPLPADLPIGAGDRLAAARVEHAAEEERPGAAPVRDADVRRWVEDLRDDHLAGNAESAIPRLVSLPPGSLPELEGALAAIDVQQRHLAARVLRRRGERHGDGPSARLLEVTVEGLAAGLADQLIARRLCETWNPAADCTRFLAGHAHTASESLRRALAGGDSQQRFLAAWLLALAADERDAPAICRELVPRLADNAVAGDAVMAANGLYRLGAASLPTLRAWRPWVDEQARSLIDLVELDLSDPPVTLGQFAVRRGMHRVSDVYHDPASEFDVSRSRVPQWSSR
jgi:hypothetical protein